MCIRSLKDVDNHYIYCRHDYESSYLQNSEKELYEPGPGIIGYLGWWVDVDDGLMIILRQSDPKLFRPFRVIILDYYGLSIGVFGLLSVFSLFLNTLETGLYILVEFLRI